MVARQFILAAVVVLNIFLLYSLVWGTRGTIAYNDLKVRCELFEERIRLVEESNLELSKEIRLLQSDRKYLEKTIRNRLNFVRENEVLYIFPDEAKVDASGAPLHETKD